jgi:lipopolysaccharide transport system ATP-binding protein
MEGASKAGRTILFVSHNVQAITRLCTRALLLSHGRVITIGPVADVVDFYYITPQGTHNAARL